MSASLRLLSFRPCSALPLCRCPSTTKFYNSVRFYSAVSSQKPRVPKYIIREPIVNISKSNEHTTNKPIAPPPIATKLEEPVEGAPDSFLGKFKYYLTGYKSLSKAKLGSLVLATTIVGYGMSPGAFDLSTLLIVSSGTWLTICSANSINQIIEVTNDSQMNRTKKRWLPTKKLSLTHAKAFAVVTGVTGVGSLLFINPLTSALALFNLGLYTAVYTPLKQKNPVNTWVGAIVGAIPPMIGWAAGTGGAELGSWVIGGLLAFWQMPHFMALSYALKDDYHRGGFKMLVNTHPEKVPGVILRYSLAMVPLGLVASLSGMTTWIYAIDSLVPTGYLTYLALKFRKQQDKQIARNIFKFSLLMLPMMMGLMYLHKNPNPTTSSATFGELKQNVLTHFGEKKSQKKSE